jgi:signal peptidase I
MKMKSESWLLIQLGVAIVLLTLLSFWFVPVYTAGASLGFTLLADAFKLVLAYKFGRSIPQQITDAKPGQTSDISSRMVTTPEPPAAVPPAAPPAQPPSLFARV